MKNKIKSRNRTRSRVYARMKKGRFTKKDRPLRAVSGMEEKGRRVQPSRGWWSSLENMMVWLE